MQESETTTKPRGILGYDPSLDDELFAFQRAEYPERDPELIEPRWKWMFLESAARLNVEPMVWLYRAKSGIVGHQGAIPVRLKLDDQQVTTGWFVETMVLESHRGKAVGPMLIKKALEDLPLNLSLGQTAAMRELQFALGWQQVAPLEQYMYVLNANRVLAGKTRGAVSKQIAAVALGMQQRLSGGNQLRSVPHEFSSRRIDRFDERHDELWTRVSRDLRCVVVRDASYLNWKFVDQPGQNLIRLEISRSTDVVAVAILQVREPDEHYRYRRAFIVDLIVPIADAAAITAALACTCQQSAKLQVDALIFPLINDRLARHLTNTGFHARPPTRYLLVASDEPTTPELPLTPDAWHITMGDSDIDRLW